MIELCKIDSFLIRALSEDIGSGDVTTSAVVPEGMKARAVIVAKEVFTLAGVPLAERTFSLVDPKLRFRAYKKDGDMVKKGDVIARTTGSGRSLLKAERVALNILQRLSGIATLTRKFADSVEGLPVKITDTRKTTPGMRILEKYAVRVGGGQNHRSGLFDGILIKDNHINLAGSIGRAVRAARKNAHHIFKVEVEVKNLREVKSALSAGADVIMLDNMSVQDIKKAVKIIRREDPDVIIEASGGMRIENMRDVAETGVDLISTGAITHSAVAVDISMDIFPAR